MANQSTLKYLIIFSALSVGLAVGLSFYQLTLQAFKAEKASSNNAMLSLTGAFVETYAQYRTHYLKEDAPVPATFRAKASHSFNEKNIAAAEAPLTFSLVGIPGKEIQTLPYDTALHSALLQLDSGTTYSASTKYISLSGETYLRSIFPSIASSISCVSCHNKLQNPDIPWKLNDLMGAFVIDQPIGQSVRMLKLTAIVLAVLIASLIYLSMTLLATRRSSHAVEQEEEVTGVPAVSGELS